LDFHFLQFQSLGQVPQEFSIHKLFDISPIVFAVTLEKEGCLSTKHSRKKKISSKYSVETESSYESCVSKENTSKAHNNHKGNVNTVSVGINHDSVETIQHSKECQTDPVDGEDFDWDLSETSDTETKVVWMTYTYRILMAKVKISFRHLQFLEQALPIQSMQMLQSRLIRGLCSITRQTLSWKMQKG
jgi:hypothetical protein